MVNKQKDLIEQVKLAKVYSGYSYKYFAECIKVTDKSFYNWLQGQYNLSYSKAYELEEIVADILS